MGHLVHKTSNVKHLSFIANCRFLVPVNTQKNHFWLKMMVKSGLETIILKFHDGLQRYLLTCQANSAFPGRFFCTGQQQLWRPSWNFKIIFSRPLFTIIFKPKMVSNLCKNFLCFLCGTRNIQCTTVCGIHQESESNT